MSRGRGYSNVNPNPNPNPTGGVDVEGEGISLYPESECKGSHCVEDRREAFIRPAYE